MCQYTFSHINIESLVLRALFLNKNEFLLDLVVMKKTVEIKFILFINLILYQIMKNKIVK